MRDAVPARPPASADEINGRWDIEQWLETLRQVKGHYTPVDIDAKSFAGSVTSKMTGGFSAVDIVANGIIRADRTSRDVRLDSYDHYYALFQTAGKPISVAQQDTVSELSVGSVAIVKSTLPVTYASRQSSGRWLSLVLPRAELISHLGFEPRLRPVQRSAPLERLLFEFALNIADPDAHPDANWTWMKLAFYDLIGRIICRAQSGKSDIAQRQDLLSRLQHGKTSICRF